MGGGVLWAEYGDGMSMLDVTPQIENLLGIT